MDTKGTSLSQSTEYFVSVAGITKKKQLYFSKIYFVPERNESHDRLIEIKMSVNRDKQKLNSTHLFYIGVGDDT